MQICVGTTPALSANQDNFHEATSQLIGYNGAPENKINRHHNIQTGSYFNGQSDSKPCGVKSN